MSSREFEDAERAMRQVQARSEGNEYCADCATPRPEYVNLTLGTFICSVCAEVHRSRSNRRIKDIFGRDLTMQDVRRMDSVGNDVANRKFLATWSPEEYPEPKQSDKKMLEEFIWLKYEGSWKKRTLPAPQPRQDPAPSSGYDRYYGNVPNDRSSRGGYGRERDIFRDSVHSQPAPPLPPPRSFWADRLNPLPTRPLSNDDFSRRPPAGSSLSYGPPRHNEPLGRFMPPQSQAYSRPIDAGPRYEDVYEEEYPRREREIRAEPARQRHSTRNDQRTHAASRKKKNVSRYESEDEEDSESPEEATERGKARKKGTSESKTRKAARGVSRKKKPVSEDDATESEDEEFDDRYERDSKKKSSSKKTKTSKKKTSKKRNAKNREESESSYESDESDEETEDDEEYKTRSSKKSSRKSKAKSSATVESVTNPFSDVHEGDDQEGQSGPKVVSHHGKTEFDLMSDWMGGDTDVTTLQSTSSSQTASTQPPQQVAGSQGMQMPMVAPPMSVYGGIMPAGGAAYMTGFPVMTPQGVVHMPAVAGMANVQAIPTMPGMQGMAGMPTMGMMPQMGMPGLVNGLQGLTLQPGMQQPGMQQPGVQQPGVQQPGVQQPVPPPPPPGMPAGPPPGPPPS